MELTDRHTAAFYGSHSWPGPDAILSRKWVVRFGEHLSSERPLRLLDAGCGSGQDLAGMLAEYPEMSGVGIDLSELSIEYAGKLLDRVGASARAELHVMSFSEPLPWTEESNPGTPD